MLTAKRRRCPAGTGLAIALLALTPLAAVAQDVPFAFLVKDGWKALNTGVTTRLDQSLVSLHATGALHPIAGGQTGAAMGTAFVQAFTRSVPDPTFAALQPLAGLVVLDFGAFQGHLALFDTPTGLQTTVAIIDANGVTDPRISGSWVLGNGAGLGGGTADDLTVGVLVHFGQPSGATAITLDIPPYFPLVAFANDRPFQRFGVPYISGAATCLGSSYAQAQGPLRVYTLCDDVGLGAKFDAALLVMHTGGANYAVLACSRFYTPAAGGAVIDALVRRCTVSGAGVLGRLSGGVTSFSVAPLGHDVLQLAIHVAP
ncbi:MAG: hypothetical protein AB7U83_16190 [Vicinamibacterales bacterium]